MKQPGRKSASALSTPPIAVIPERRLPPPETLSERQRALWLSITGARPGTWFDAASAPLLEALVRHLEAVALVHVEVDAFEARWLREPGGAERFKLLLEMRERQSRAILALSRALRLSPQSIYHPEVAGTRAIRHRALPERRPWD